MDIGQQEPAISHRLYRKIEPQNHVQCNRFTSVCSFPWTSIDYKLIWHGRLSTQYGAQGETEWNEMIEHFADACIFGGMGSVTICSTYRVGFPTSMIFEGLKDEPLVASGWAFRNQYPFSPIAILTFDSRIFILDVQNNVFLGALRGHGGPIHAVAVHPNEPHLFCTTSRDFTARIYNLNLTAATGEDVKTNPHWSPRESFPSRAGAPHGLRAVEPEGYVIPTKPPTKKNKSVRAVGRCVKVLVGSRAAGHQQPVLCAAWHPTLPLIATGGLDRAVKIWRTIPPEDGTMAREDKPLFHCVELHKAGVMSVAWIDEDTLITHDRPALMDVTGRTAPGMVIQWKWLALRRFFPLGQETAWYQQPELVGSMADFSASYSFEIIAQKELPEQESTLRTKVYNHRYLYPIIAMPLRRSVRLMVPSELPLYERHKAVPPPDRYDVAALEDRLKQLDVSGLPLRETTQIAEDDIALVTVDLSIAGKIIVGVDDVGRAWVWVGSCDFAKAQKA